MSERWLHIQPRGYYFAGVRRPRGARGARTPGTAGGRPDGRLGEYRADGEKMVAGGGKGGREAGELDTDNRRRIPRSFNPREDQRSRGHRASLGRCAKFTRFSARPRLRPDAPATLVPRRSSTFFSLSICSSSFLSWRFLYADTLGGRDGPFDHSDANEPSDIPLGDPSQQRSSCALFVTINRRLKREIK